MVVKIESKAKGLCGHVSWCIQIKIQYFHTHTIWPLPLPRHTSTVWWEDGMEQMRAQQVHGLRIDYHWGQGDIDRWQMKPREIPTQNGTRTGISPFTIKTIPVFFSLHHLSSPFLSALYPPPTTSQQQKRHWRWLWCKLCHPQPRQQQSIDNEMPSLNAACWRQQGHQEDTTEAVTPTGVTTMRHQQKLPQKRQQWQVWWQWHLWKQ